MIHLVTKLSIHERITKIARKLHTVNGNQNKESHFVTVYKFPYIRPLAAVNRLKILQTVLTGVSIPCTLSLNLMNFVSFEAVQVVSALGISGCVTFYGLGFVTRKFVGFIYYNEEKNLVKVAYIDFWGKRQDIVIPSADIIPREEIPRSITDMIYTKLRRYSTDEYLKYNIRFANIVDQKIFDKIL
ncbi:transmembrane protein 186 [Diorhabda sublineata]|uniref:transmembrane protein 186 n=1 Tax=Diorhabda sublineata TaxID=1163346 RepID=UPI0024E136FF|nr:transmembrane protein 186 [Diorhabda sublineata]